MERTRERGQEVSGRQARLCVNISVGLRRVLVGPKRASDVVLYLGTGHNGHAWCAAGGLCSPFQLRRAEQSLNRGESS